MNVIDDRRFDSAIRTGKAVVIFTGANCAYCKMLESTIEQIRGSFPGIIFYEYNTDYNHVISSRLAIQGIPQLYLYRNGNMFLRHAGNMDKGQLINILNQL